jgi:integrase
MNTKKVINIQKKITFKRITEEYLLFKKQQVKESTYFNYAYKIHKYLLPTFRNLSLEEISTYDFNKFSEFLLDEKNLSNKFSKDILSVLKSILKFADRKYDIKMKTDLINLPKVKNNNFKVFSESDKRKLKKHCFNSNDTREIGIIVCLYTGLRIGEICALKWEDIDFSKKVIYVRHTLQRVYVAKSNTKIVIDVPKSEKSVRSIPMSKIIYEKLKELKENCNKDDFFLTGDNSIFIEPRGYQYTFKKILKECKVQQRNFHMLRHTFATDCISVGMDVKSLSEILGHSDVGITLNRYVHSSYKMKKKFLEKLA